MAQLAARRSPAASDVASSRRLAWQLLRSARANNSLGARLRLGAQTPIAELDRQSQQHYGLLFTSLIAAAHEHPVVLPHVLHFKQVPFLTSVKFPHSPQLSPT